jgi:hypothetical protein
MWSLFKKAGTVDGKKDYETLVKWPRDLKIYIPLYILL